MSYIGFLDKFRDAIESGQKTMTCRRERRGRPGDVLETPWGFNIKIIGITRVPLGEVASMHWKDEGVPSESEFIRIWESIHPERGFRPKEMVWLHTFEVIK